MMDEMYIKMCQEAKEIQEGWEPKPADKVVLVRLDDNPYGLKGSYHLDHLDKDAKDWSNEDLHNEGIYWLPRQEDLQKIIYENTIKGPGGLIKDFWDWIIKAQNLVYIRIEDSITGYWLCFVMETCYHKQWNRETQTWETTQ